MRSQANLFDAEPIGPMIVVEESTFWTRGLDSAARTGRTRLSARRTVQGLGTLLRGCRGRASKQAFACAQTPRYGRPAVRRRAPLRRRRVARCSNSATSRFPTGKAADVGRQLAALPGSATAPCRRKLAAVGRQPTRSTGP